MLIQNLIENSCKIEGLVPEHGLSFYVELNGKKVLFDTGASERFIQNARKLGIDLSQVEILVISHGHYDHTGGIEAFMECNQKADIYMQKAAAGEFYSIRETGNAYIGIPAEVKKSKRIQFLEGDVTIDENLSVFTGVTERKLWPKSNTSLKEMHGGKLVQDAFTHEQNLKITCGKKEILVSGCGHSGIVNIMEKYQQLYGRYPDVVIGGFHLTNPRSGEMDEELVEQIGRKLLTYGADYYTCHCTGEEAFVSLKQIMGEKLHGISTGEKIII